MERGKQLFAYTAPGVEMPQFAQLFQRQGTSNYTLVVRDPTGFIVAIELPVEARIDMARVLHGKEPLAEMSAEHRVAFAQRMLDGLDFHIGIGPSQ